MAGRGGVTRVVALVPYFGREAQGEGWLGSAIESLLAQSRAPEAIVVVDDASPRAPDAVVARYPAVSLYRNERNTGPFAIDDAVFAAIEADAVLLQDADDLSLPSRLARLLREFEAGCELVGSQIRHVAEAGFAQDGPDLEALPLDPRARLLEQPTAHTLLLPGALVSVALARRLGGFASGFRFGVDNEFVRRAVFGGRACNVDEVLYVRRLHPGSLTRAAETGFGSPARLAVQAQVQARARELVRAMRDGEVPDLLPMQKRAVPTPLVHVSGPRVAGLPG